jgi:CheY-like chemotaxis protein
MKKILIAHDLMIRHLNNSGFLGRSGITIFTAATNDDILNIHSREKVDLIVAKLDMPGQTSEAVFDVIRQRKELRGTAVILICDDSSAQRARSIRCSANAVLALPVDETQLHQKMLQLLDIAPRQAYRVTLKVSVQGKFKNKSFLYRTDNISATGMLIAAEIRAEETLVPGDQLSFSFFLPDGKQINATGKVERVIPQTVAEDTCLYGIKFSDISPSVQSTIEAFINKEQYYKHSLDSHSETNQGS